MPPPLLRGYGLSGHVNEGGLRQKKGQGILHSTFGGAEQPELEHQNFKRISTLSCKMYSC